METHIVYHIDKGLSIITIETSDHFDLILAREDGRNQGDPFKCGEGAENQTFPAWRAEVGVRR